MSLFGRSTGAGLFVFGFAALCATSALATASGVRINNTVTVSYSVDTVSQDDETAAAGFVVDRKIDVLVSDQASIIDGRPKETNRQLVFKVTNEGNDSQPFDIDVTVNGSLGSGPALDTNTDTLGAGEYRIYISDDATLDGGDTVYDPAGFSTADTPAAFDSGGTGDEFHVIIVINVPSDAANGDEARFSVAAKALNATENGILVEDLGNGLDDAATPSNAVDIVFADGAKTTDSAGTDVAEDAIHTDNATLTVASAELTATKAVTIVNDDLNISFDCTTDADPGTSDLAQGAIPGSCLEYTITVANGAAASENADSVSLSDTLPAGVTFSAFTSTTGWTSPDHTAGVITATATNTLAPNNSLDLVFRVTVD